MSSKEQMIKLIDEALAELEKWEKAEGELGTVVPLPTEDVKQPLRRAKKLLGGERNHA